MIRKRRTKLPDPPPLPYEGPVCRACDERLAGKNFLTIIVRTGGAKNFRAVWINLCNWKCFRKWYS